MKNLVAFEPVFKAGTVQAAVALAFAFGINLSAEVTGTIEGGAAAVLALVTATVVDKVSPTVYTGILTAAGTLAVAFGIPNVSSGAVSAVYAMLAIVMASLLREKVSPAYHHALHKPAEKRKNAD